MITMNYHTHTKRCRHASGADREYVIAAIENGFEKIGFSDHAPMLFPKGYYSGFRMYPNATEDYINSLRALKKEFSDKISICIGFELEYYPDLFEAELRFLKQFDIDYLILGQHCTLNEYEKDSAYCGVTTKSVKDLDDYVNQSIGGIKTGKFSYLAHPDLINFIGDKGIYKDRMYFLCREIKRLGYPLEFNMLGFTDKRNYPNSTFWRIAAEVGNDVVIGLDAHSPKVYSDSKSVINAEKYLEQLGLTPIKDIRLIKP